MSDLHASGQLGIEGLNVAVANLAAWKSEHEIACAGRWRTAIVLLITNLTAVIGGLALLLYHAPHGG